MEYRKRCNVCGHIFCYTDGDIADSNTAKTMTAISAIGTMAAVFGGTRLDAYALDAKGDREQAKIKDFDHCPNCNSTNLTLLTADEYEELSQQAGSGVSINPNASVETLIKRAEIFIEESEWTKAKAYCEQALDMEPENGMAYYLLLLISRKAKSKEELYLDSELNTQKNYRLARKFGDDSIQSVLDEIDKGHLEYIAAKEEAIKEAHRKKRLEQFENDKTIIGTSNSITEINNAIADIETFGGEFELEEIITKGKQRIKELEAVQEKKGKIIVIVSAVIGVAALVIGAVVYEFNNVILPKQKYDNAVKTFGQDMVNQYESLKVGSSFVFGSYEQDNDSSNGAEPIEWDVLAKDGRRALLISKNVLDEKPYHNSQKMCHWEESSLRRWLNGGFYETAFTAAEKEAIPTVTVDTLYLTKETKKYGADTNDKVFLLSTPEAVKYYPSKEEMKCVPTQYAIAQGAHVYEGSTLWWFRSRGYDNGIQNSDYYSDWGGKHATVSLGVRPVIWIDFGY